MTEDQNNSKWKKLLNQEMDTPKFPPKDAELTIFATPEPEETTVDGRFGKQKVFIVRTNIGLVYLSQKQFIRVAQVLGNLPNIRLAL